MHAILDTAKKQLLRLLMRFSQVSHKSARTMTFKKCSSLQQDQGCSRCLRSQFQLHPGQVG